MATRLTATHTLSTTVHPPDDALINFLLVEGYLPDARIYVLSDLSIALVFAVTGIPCLHQSHEALQAISAAVGRACGQAEIAGTKISSTLYPSLDISEPVHRYVNAGGDDDPLLMDIARAQVEQLERGKRVPLLQSQDGSYRIQVRTLGHLLTVVMPYDTIKSSFWDAIFRVFADTKPATRAMTTDEITTRLQPAAVGKFLRNRDKLLEGLRDTTTRVTSALNNVGAKLRPVEPTELMATITRLLYPGYDGPAKEWNPAYPISAQIALGGDVVSDDAAGYVKAGPDYHRCLSLAEMPITTQPGMLTQPLRDLDWTSIADYLHDGHITISCTLIEKRKVRFYLEDKRDSAKAGYVSSGKAQTVLDDAVLALARLDGGSMKYFSTRISAVVHGSSPDESQVRVKALRNAMSIAGLTMIEETHFAASIFWGALPLGHHDIDPDSMREWWFDERMVADVLPIYTQDRGTKSATSIFLNRAGEPFTLGLFDTSAGMWTVVGISGTGKSFLCQRIILDWLRGKTHTAIIIDKGGSYRALISKFGSRGTNIELGDTCINPFEGDVATASEFLNEFLPGLILLTPEQTEERGIISQTIEYVYARKRRQPQPYASGADLAALPPNVYLHHARKRVIARMPDAEVVQQIEALREHVGDRPYVFDISYKVRLTGRRWTDPDTREPRSEDFANGLGSVDDASREWLTIRDYEFLPPADNNQEVWALAASEAKIRQMDTEGFIYHRHPTEVIVDVETEADLAALIECGLQIIPTDVWRAKAYAEVRSLHPQESEQDIADRVSERLAGVSAQDIFAEAPGFMTLQEEVTFTDFGLRLDAMAKMGDTIASSLANRFREYWGNGVSSRYFDGPTAIYIDGYKIVGFELTKIAKQSDHLYAAVVGALLYKLMLHGKQPANRSFNKLWVLDESWQLIQKSAAVAAKITEVGREGRKYGIYMGLVSQYASDFLKTTAGAKIMDAAQTRLYLRQQESDIAMIQEKCGWTADECALLGSVRSKPGHFAEFIVEVKGATKIFDVARYIPTPQVLWLCTTSNEETKYREQVRRAFKEMGQNPNEAMTSAIRWLAENYRNGLPKGTVGKALPASRAMTAVT